MQLGISTDRPTKKAKRSKQHKMSTSDQSKRASQDESAEHVKAAEGMEKVLESEIRNPVARPPIQIHPLQRHQYPTLRAGTLVVVRASLWRRESWRNRPCAVRER